MKIVSGAQAGVDRAALDAALEYGGEVGGWCPEGRLAEDGAIPLSYPVIELTGAGYSQRTRQNVIDSDGTVIIYFSYLSGGTEQTLLRCVEESRPYLLVDANELQAKRAALRVIEFTSLNNIEVLNVAGPRASGEPKAYHYTKRVISTILLEIAP